MNNTTTQSLTPLTILKPVSSDEFEFDFSMCHGPYCGC